MFSIGIENGDPIPGITWYQIETTPFVVCVYLFVRYVLLYD